MLKNKYPEVQIIQIVGFNDKDSWQRYKRIRAGLQKGPIKEQFKFYESDQDPFEFEWKKDLKETDLKSYLKDDFNPVRDICYKDGEDENNFISVFVVLYNEQHEICAYYSAYAICFK